MAADVKRWDRASNVYNGMETVPEQELPECQPPLEILIAFSKLQDFLRSNEWKLYGKYLLQASRRHITLAEVRTTPETIHLYLLTFWGLRCIYSTMGDRWKESPVPFTVLDAVKVANDVGGIEPQDLVTFIRKSLDEIADEVL